MSDRSDRYRRLEERTRRFVSTLSNCSPREYFGEYLHLKIPEIEETLVLPIELLDHLLKLGICAAAVWERESICTEKEGDTVERETERTEAEPPPFAPGDVVRLKSGGPPLTVLGPEPNPIGVPRLILSWFTSGGEIRTERLPPSALERVENPETVEAKGEQRPPKVKRARYLAPGDRLDLGERRTYAVVGGEIDGGSREIDLVLERTSESPGKVLRRESCLPAELEVVVR